MHATESARRPWPLRVLGARWDIALGLCAVLFSVPFLSVPFAHDQGLYAYVAREWVQHGSIPYRDVYDHKTPGIYIIHAIALLLFGSNSWGIRLMDTGCLLALGLIAARLVLPKGARAIPGFRGLCCLIASVLHYGFFTYWDTAQSEIWYATFGVGAVCLAWHMKEERRAQFLSGLVIGVALVIKPPALWFGFVVLGVFLIRERKAGGRGLVSALKILAIFGAGAAIPVGLVLLYFGMHGALPAMYDIVIGANSHYIVHESNIDSVADLYMRPYQFLISDFPFSPLVLFTIPILAIVGVKKGLPDLRNRYALTGILFVACLGCVIMQQKFYVIHWIVILGPLTVLLANLAWDGGSLVSAYLPTRIKIAPVLVAVLVLAVSFALTTASRAHWGYVAKLQYEVFTGKMTRKEYARAFQNAAMYYYEIDIENVSDYIAAHSLPTDTICVRGFNPEIYILTDRHYEGRFFWSIFLTDARRDYHRAAYLAEDREAFARSKPRYVVALPIAHDTLDAPEWYLPLGYEVRQEFGSLVLLERRTGS